MSAGRHAVHQRHLFIDGRSVVHRLAPETKLTALAVFVTAVAVTPRRLVGVFVIDAAVLIGVFLIARLPGAVLARLLVVVPFVVSAAFVPFIAGGEQIDVIGVGVSVDGLWATWNLLAKATLGAFAGIIVSSTTSLPEVLHGLARLRVPSVLVAIIAFMFRYLDLLTDQLHRMRTAMTARGHDPRWLWQARPVASSAGVLFVRSYERGERIHQAMLARGFVGTMPDLNHHHTTFREWLYAAIPATIAVGAAAAFTIAAS